MRSLFITIFLAFIFLRADAQLTTAKLFNDHAVLQRNQAVPVWGWAKKNSRVNLSFNGQVVSAKADASGRWEVTLKPMNAGGPYVMKISSGKDQLVYNDMMLGEVWICSGQSNMEFHLRDAFGYNAEQKTAAALPISQFTVPNKLSLQPENELTGGQWIKADTNTAGNFTAVGYFFAKKLAQNLHVAVGLIYSNWGGTPVEDWISKEAMLASPEMSAVAKGMPQNESEFNQRADRQLKAYAYHNQPVVNYTAQQLAGQPGAFFNDWQKGNAPGAWEWMGKLYSYRGEGFMQKTIKLDSSYASRPSVIRLGVTDAEMAVYINGKLINSGRLPANFLVDLPAGTWKSGDNSLLVNFLPQQKYGLGLNAAGNDLYVKFADTSVNLADANWHTMPDLSKPYHFDFLPNNVAFSLYNSMINPLIPYAMAGVIWYQGESNVDRAFQYRTTFPMMITDWRSRWKRQFPFLFVQISSFGGMQNSNAGSSWAELREAQTLTLQLPNTGMAVTTDIGDAFNIHPRDKADVGFRLADKALSMTYHLPGFLESPLFRSAEFKEGAAIVSLTNSQDGLVVKDKYGYIRGFEIAGSDRRFYYAQAVVTSDNKVKVWCAQVAQPAAVRYAWTDAPVDANLFNKEGFPVGPFRSDDWKGITDDKKFE